MSSLVVPAWAWALLAGLMISLVSFDLVVHRGDRVDSRRHAILWSVVWVGVAVLFGGFVTLQFGAAAGQEYFSVYLLEKSLSVDNLFLFLVIFGALKIPREHQRRVLTWGIVGALVMRGAFIAVGAAALHRWHELTYVFGAILVVTAIKLLRKPKETEGPPRIIQWLERHLPWTAELHGPHFVTRVPDDRGGIGSGMRRVATPLLVALVAIEVTDVVFALDSIPAAFAVTKEPFIIYSANVFAILGLRALYIVLAGLLVELRYLHFGLAAVLAFAGGKMIAAPWIHISPLVSVLVIFACLGVAIAASVFATRREQRVVRPSS